MSVDRRGINSDFVEKIKQTNNIVTVAGRYLPLKQKGKTHWACCPFHHEKTASFAVNELQQFYHCFGCGVSGDVITLVQQLESLDFYGAVEFLAKMSGLEMPAVVLDQNWAKTLEKKRRVLRALEEVCRFYCRSLYKESGREYLEYLHNRGINDELVKLFNIGVCGNWDASIKYLRGKGFTDADLVDAGIAGRGKNGGLYDVMGARITFAIFNTYGECIGFSGRTLSTDAEIAKYKNTAQTIVFDKGSIVYGIDVLKKNKLSNFVDRLVVVEGNVDVISLVGAGIVNTVACMGTAITAYHAKVLKRFSDKIYICFDGDAAGQKAALRGLDILAGENLEVRVVSISDGLDPDDFIRKHGKDAFVMLMDGALPLIDFKLEHLRKTMSLKDNLDKTKFLKNAVQVLKQVQTGAELELYIPRVSELTGISYDAIAKEVGEAAPQMKNKPNKTNSEKNTQLNKAAGSSSSVPLNTAYVRALNFVVASFLHNKEYISETDFEPENKLYKRLIEKVAEYLKNGRTWNVARVFDEFDEAEVKQLEPLINFPFESAGKEGLAKYYQDCVKYLLRAGLQRSIDQLKEQYKQTDDTEEKMRIMVKIQELNKRIKNK